MTPDPDQSDRGERFTRLLIEDQRRVYALVFALVHNRAAADDVMQEVCVTLWKKFDDYTEGTSFFAWAATVARFHVQNWRRKQANRTLALDDRSYRALVDTAERVAESRGGRIDALEHCVELLRPDQRSLLRLRYQEDRAVREIAATRGKSDRAIYKTLAKIHRRLLDCIRQRLAEPA